MVLFLLKVLGKLCSRSLLSHKKHYTGIKTLSGNFLSYCLHPFKEMFVVKMSLDTVNEPRIHLSLLYLITADRRSRITALFLIASRLYRMCLQNLDLRLLYVR